MSFLLELKKIWDAITKPRINITNNIKIDVSKKLRIKPPKITKLK